MMPSYMSPNAGVGGGGIAVSQLSANEYSCTQEPKINFEDLTPYLTYEYSVLTIV